MTTVSVLMPTYRGAQFVDAALESVVAQDDPDVEVVVTDDGSDDGTMERVESYRDRLTLRVLDGARTKNWVASTNVALRAARGTYACMLHQDDGMRPGRLRALRAALARHPSARWALHAVDVVDEAGGMLAPWHPPFGARARLVEPDELTARLVVQNAIGIPAPLFRTDDAREAGGLDETLWYTADWDLWLRLSARGPAVFLPDRLAFYRVHGQAQTITRSRDAANLRAQLETVLARHEGRLAPDAAPARPAARLSIEVNLALAQLAHGDRPELAPLLGALRRCSPAAVGRFLHDSRIHERVAARLVARARGRLAV